MSSMLQGLIADDMMILVQFRWSGRHVSPDSSVSCMLSDGNTGRSAVRVAVASVNVNIGGV